MSKAGDPRLGQLLIRNPNPDAKARVAIIGYPCDLGVQKNGGRIGAAKGPSIIHQLLPRLGTVVNPEFNVDLSKIDFQNTGDIKFGATDTLEEIHKKLQVFI